MAATYEERAATPSYWLRGKTWGERYSLFNEWTCLLCGTRTRYDWLLSRRRIVDDASEILH